MRNGVTALIATIIAANAFAQTNATLDNFSVVTNLWYEGHKSNVLAIAEGRLASNSNDLAGLILKFEYDLSSMDASNYSNDIARILAVSHSVTNGFFSEEKRFLESALLDFLDYIAHRRRQLSPEQEAIERAKGTFMHKPMAHEIPLKALHDDGLF